MDGNKPKDLVSRKKHTQEGPEKDKGELRVSPRRKLPPTKPPEELDRYPSKTKMNAYSKPEYISDIAEVLKGKAEMQMLLDSPFGYLFGIPANSVPSQVWGECDSINGVIACGKNPIRPQDTTVEMTKNVKFFLKYPWGRLSFTRTLERIANFQTPSDVKKLIRCVKDGSYALQGFPLALQLFAFETIPSLAKLAPDDEANRTFTQRSIHHLASLRPIRTSSILACEAAEEVEVTYLVKPDDNICPPSLSWDDEVEDPRVAYIERLMLAGHEWQEEEWVGGSAAFPKQERPPQLGEIHAKKRKRNVRGPNAPVLKKQKSVVEDENEETAEDCSEDPQFEKFVVELRRLLSFLMLNSSSEEDDQVEANNEGGFTANAGHDFLTETKIWLRLEYLTFSWWTYTFPSGAGDGGESVLVGTQSGTEEKASADTEMEEIPSPVPSTSAQLVHSQGQMEKATADTEMVENPSGLPATSGQGEEHGAGVESEANVGEEPEIGEDNDRDTSSQAEHTEEPGTRVDAGDVPKVVPECKVDDSVLQGTPSDPPSPFAVVLQELETTASMDLDAANVKEGVLEEQGIVAGVEEQEDSNPGLDEADTTVGTPEILFRAAYSAGNVPFNPLDKVDASKLELLTNVLDGENVKHTLFGYRKVDNEFFSMLVKQGNWVDNMGFKWGQRLYDIANGIHIHREPSLRWIKDVDVVYAPMNWRGDHWVGLAIHLRARNIIVYDAFIDYTRESAAWSKMKPVCEMMPYLVRAMCADVLPQTYSVEPFGYERDLNVAQNPSSGDCGPYAMKFLELLAFGNPMSDLVNIQESDMAIYRQVYATEIYEHGKREGVPHLNPNMSYPNIPDDVLAKIAKIIAHKCWWYLQPLLRSGPRGRDIVYRPDVLQDANIYSLCSDPDDFHAAGHDPNDIHTEGRYRPFFKRCVDAGNPIAIYHEGLRLLTHESDIKGAIVLLHRNVPNHADATLACAILSICDGNAYMGAEYLRMFERNHYSLQSEDTRDMCEELLDEIKKYGLTYNNTYGATFSYPEFRGFNTPPCAMMCYIRSGPFKNVCNVCYLWWCAKRISQLL
ncbi:unnamed protein product [Arabidopsis arenosa]|uniref:Ubiquitin-like protease family profile domain-containing protein n=1 Tax=Arabidopsis arenosa TaxID=38785 RepID=A0A8S1ZHQ2_ARAAE|nr:unnamed protein product [Arabidopsis arenosa]